MGDSARGSALATRSSRWVAPRAPGRPARRHSSSSGANRPRRARASMATTASTRSSRRPRSQAVRSGEVTRQPGTASLTPVEAIPMDQQPRPRPDPGARRHHLRRSPAWGTRCAQQLGGGVAGERPVLPQQQEGGPGAGEEIDRPPVVGTADVDAVEQPLEPRPAQLSRRDQPARHRVPPPERPRQHPLSVPGPPSSPWSFRPKSSKSRFRGPATAISVISTRRPRPGRG